MFVYLMEYILIFWCYSVCPGVFEFSVFHVLVLTCIPFVCLTEVSFLVVFVLFVVPW